jgi:ankyrin repeat protein
MVPKNCKLVADVNKQSVEGTTPLHIACSLNRKHMVQLLLEKGARMDFVDQDGYTPY